MTDLVAFLRERLDEDEAVARSAVPVDWEDTGPILAGVVADRGMVTIAVCNRSDFDGGEYSYPADSEEAARSVHIARHDPARVLREVEAKRRIVDLAVRDHAESETAADEYVHGRAMSLMDAVALLALPYDQHPDYQERWRP